MAGSRDDVFRAFDEREYNSSDQAPNGAVDSEGREPKKNSCLRGGTTESSLSYRAAERSKKNSLEHNKTNTSSTSSLPNYSSPESCGQEEEDSRGSKSEPLSGDLSEGEIKKSYLAVFREIEGRDYISSTLDKTLNNARLAAGYAVVNSVAGDRLEKLARYQAAARLFLRTAYETRDEFVRKHGPQFWVLMHPDRLSRYLSESYRAGRTMPDAPSYDPEECRSPLDPTRWPSLEAWKAELEPVLAEWLKQSKASNGTALKCALESLRRAADQFGVDVEDLPNGKVFLFLASQRAEASADAELEFLDRLMGGGEE